MILSAEYLAAVAAAAKANTNATSPRPEACAFCCSKVGDYRCQCAEPCEHPDCWAVPGNLTKSLPGELHNHYPVPRF